MKFTSLDPFRTTSKLMQGQVVTFGGTSSIFCYIFWYHLRKSIYQGLLSWWKELWDQVFETISSSKKSLISVPQHVLSKAFKWKACFSSYREEENSPRKKPPTETVFITPQMQAANGSFNTSLGYVCYRGAYTKHHHTNTGRLKRKSKVNVTTWTKASSGMHHM